MNKSPPTLPPSSPPTIQPDLHAHFREGHRLAIEEPRRLTLPIPLAQKPSRPSKATIQPKPPG